VRALQRGGLVAHPTDTLVALAASARDPSAVERLLMAKGRSATHRLSVALSSTEEIERWAELDEPARMFVRTHLPGPYTLLARPSTFARRELAPAVAQGPRIGLRVPDHPLARELARRVGPLTATSANRTGEPPATNVAAARRALGRAVDVYVDAPPRPSGRPSTLVDVGGPRPRTVARRR
jgi:L-threonylcarbamoyladenylate synthase